MIKEVVDWPSYVKYLEDLRAQIKNGPFPQVVIGLTRGGLIPAVYLSHAFNLPMFPFDPHLLHRSGEPRESISLPITPGITKHVLIVDDISDSGATLQKCSTFFDSRGFSIHTASVFINKATTICVPTFSVKDSEKKWVVFPYETNTEC